MSTQTVSADDVFTQEILRNYLVATVREMVQTTVRTAYSATFAEGRDFSCSIFDIQGRMVAQDLGLAVHLGSLEAPVKRILECYPQLHDGDVILVNDPYLGTHQADCVVATPLIHGESVYGLAVNIGHWTDVGGMSPGGCAGTATHVVQEGLVIPVCRLYSRGELNWEIRDFVLSNVRMREDVWGDIQSQVASTVTAQRRMKWLIDRYGFDAVLDGMAAALAYSRKRFQAAVAAIPRGSYRAEDVMEDEGVSLDSKRICVTVEKTDEGLIIDFVGTSPQSRGPINCTFSVSKAAAYAATVSLLDPSLPVNSGCFELVTVKAEPGSLVHPIWPAPVFGSTFDLGVRIFETVVHALASVLPERAIAGSFSSGANITGSGYRAETGEEFLWYHFGEGGLGARAGRDGNSATWHLMGNPRNQPIEVWEHRFPLRFERFGLLPDSAGPGKYRGGFGVERRFRLLEDTFVSGLADRHRIPPWGLMGGGNGACNRWSVERDGVERRIDEWFPLPSRAKFFHLPLQKGDVLSLRQGGGGGYGDPRQRDEALVAEDVRDGLVSEEEAMEVYGWARSSAFSSGANERQ